MASGTDPTSVGPIEAFWRYRARTVPFAVAFAGLGAFLAFSSGGVSTATTSIVLTDPKGVAVFSDGTTSASELVAYVQQRADFVTSDLVLARVSTLLGQEVTEIEGSTDALREHVTALADEGSSILVSCDDPDGLRAASMCAAVSEAYQELSRTQTESRADLAIGELSLARQQLLDELVATSLQPDPGALVTQSGALENLDVQIAETSVRATLFGSGVEFFDAPRVTEGSRIAPGIRFGVAFFAFGLLLSGTTAWLAAIRRPIVSDPEDAAEQLGAPLVGQIDDRTSGAGYEVLATNLASVGVRGIVAITGSVDVAGHTGVVVGLAEAFTREGRTVLMIDGDLRRPRLSARFGAGASSHGFTDLLGGLVSEAEAVRVVRLPDGPGISFMSCGRSVPHASSLLRSTTARAALTDLQSKYDIVLVDTPPMLDGDAEGSAIVSVADGVVLVVASGTPSTSLGELRRRFVVLRATLLGVIYESDTK